MIALTCGKFQSGDDVRFFKKRIIGENFFPRRAGSQKIKNVLDANAGRTNARTPAALQRIDSNAMEFAHNRRPRLL